MRYLLTFSYDGTNYSGYQKQNGKKTIQSEIENVLSKINNQKIIISASGRTDAKVHALNQKAHFDVLKKLNLDKLKHSMNSLLPDDIYIKKIKKVGNNFHARYNVIEKEYVYKINIGEYNPLEKNYVFQYNHELNINDMIKGLELFIGTHDFKSFSTDTLDKDTVRTIYDAKLKLRKNIIEISFKGNGFLRYMVRNMVGILIEVGEGKRNYLDIKRVLECKDRREAGIKALPNGLYLKNVKY